MRRIIFILSLLLSLSVTAQNIVTTPLGGFYARNGVGNDRWNEQSVGSGQSVTGYPDPTVYYRRFTVPEVTNPDGTYTWARFDSKINAAIQARQKFAFRFFTMYAWPESDDFFNKTPTMSGINQNGDVVSARSAVPLEWHTAMQAGSPRNWISFSGDWVPNYNSSAYLTRLNNLHAAVANHLDTGGYTPSWSATRIDYKDVIQYIDVSGFGTWGEWHSYGTAPGNNVQNYPGYNLNDTTQDQRAGSTFPTIATFKAIIDAHKNNYPNYQLCIIINAFDAMRLGNTKIPAEVGVYAYQTRNAKGWMGRRIDHAGEQTGYDDFYLQLNPGSFGGYRMDTASMFRHNLAPFVGEPPGGPVTYNGVVQGALPLQARKWKLASIGNGNFGSGNVPTGAGGDSVRLAFSLMGYHLRINSGNVTTSGNLTINANWQNFGLTPTYDNWTVQYSLRNGAGTVVWTGNSSFDPYLFSPDFGEVPKTDIFSSPALAAGTYGLYVTVKDPTNYMVPLQLQITGRATTGVNLGSYFLTNVTLSGGTSNRPPVASAGPNQTIVLPDNDAVLTGSLSSDPDGTIASYLWTRVTGPSIPTISSPTTAVTTISNLVAGTYVMNLHIVDDDGEVSDDQVSITVNPNQAPVAEAGPNQTIVLPTSSTTLVGSGSTDDVGIDFYDWIQLTGPTSVTFDYPNLTDVGISGLIAGTYTFRLTVTDAGFLADQDVVTVTVVVGNIAPIASAGVNQTIDLPDDDVSLNASGSSDADGTITTYLWAYFSGPGGATITTPNASTTVVDNLVAGTHVIRLTVTDNNGATNIDEMQIVVNGPPNETPVSDAGNPATIQLPVDSIQLDGTNSSDDGGISTYLWDLLSGPGSYTIATPAGSTTWVNDLQAGVYFFRLTVTDSQGLTNTDVVQITVLAVPVQHGAYKWQRKFTN